MRTIIFSAIISAFLVPFTLNAQNCCNNKQKCDSTTACYKSAANKGDSIKCDAKCLTNKTEKVAKDAWDKTKDAAVKATDKTKAESKKVWDKTKKETEKVAKDIKDKF